MEEVRQFAKARFSSWRAKPRGNFPLCVLKLADARRIGARVTVAVISEDTLHKQDGHHSELTDAEYLKVQEVVDKGEAYPQTSKSIAYVMDKPGGMVVIVKATRIGDELYISSVYKISRVDNERMKEVERLKKGKG